MSGGRGTSAQPLGDREHDLAVRHPGHEERLLQPEGPEGEALGMAAGAEVTDFFERPES